VGGVAIRHADVAITTPKTGASRIAVAAHLGGPLADLVSILNREPVRLDRALGFKADVGAGSAKGKVALDLALSGSAAQRRPAVTAVALATGAELRHIVRDASFAGDLRLRLSKEEARLRGSGRLAGAPFEIVWGEPLGSAKPRQIDVSGRLDGTARSALGIPTGTVIDGPVGVQAKWTQPPRGDGRVDVALDLAEAAIDAAPIALKKPSGAAGSATARVVVREGRIAEIDDVAVRTPNAELGGQVALAPATTAVRSLHLVTTIPGSPGSEPVRLTTTVAPEGASSRVTVACDDASVWLEAIQVRSDWTGGRLDLTGKANLAWDAFHFDGHVDVRNVALNHSPVLADIVNLTSLSGVRNALTGKSGLRFDRIASDLVWTGDQLEIRDGAATGHTLRILLDGTIEGAGERVRLQGTLIPSYYGLNEMAPRIPVIGSIFGGSAKAVMTVEFTVTGSLASPKIAVKPLTSVAPGILRDVLKRLGG